MFEQTFVNTGVEARKPAAMATSLLVQSLAMGGLLLIPLLRPELLPVVRHEEPMVWMMPTPPAPSPVQQEVRVKRPIRQVVDGLLYAPARVPDKVIKFFDAPEEYVTPAVPLNAGMGGALVTLTRELPPPPPPPPVKPVEVVKPLQPVRVSTSVQAAKLVFGPRPVYPALAITARVQGVVKLHAVIAADGTMKNLEVTSGPPLLIKAAVDAVSQWRYQPTMLNGSPVEVITEIDVNFTLSQ